MAKSYDVDAHTEDALTQLQPMFGVINNAEVLRKAIALAHVVSKSYDRSTGHIDIAGIDVALRG
jgi:hypothetical protein